MLAFQVKDMTCGHCASTITKAVKATDMDANVTIDLAAQLVKVEPTEATAEEIRAAIAEAGYTPQPVEAAASGVAAPARSCCGSCH